MKHLTFLAAAPLLAACCISEPTTILEATDGIGAHATSGGVVAVAERGCTQSAAQCRFNQLSWILSDDNPNRDKINDHREQTYRAELEDLRHDR